jgi:hypothetical protein
MNENAAVAIPSLPSSQGIQLSPLHPEATAEPELGDFRYSENVVTTIELSNLNALKIEQDGIQEGAVSNAYGAGQKIGTEPTVAIIPPEDVLPMQQQEKIGGGKDF